MSALLDLRPTDASLLYLSYRIDSDMANRAILTIAIADPASAELYQAMARELAKEGTDRPGGRRLPGGLRINPRLPGAHTELGDLFYHSQDESCRPLLRTSFKRP